MGGNAFEMAERLTKDEYEAFCSSIDSMIWNESYDTAIPESVREKESYGDVDLLVVGDGVQIIKELFEKKFEVFGEIKNTSGYNLLVRFGEKKVQVDLNKVKWEDFDFALQYFSWNDLGNLIGRIAHRQGLKFGHDGLWYVHRDGDQQLGEILITDSFNLAVEYLGFDVDAYWDGFDTFDQMFTWVKNSKYFEACAFPLEHRNHAARVRDAKRKTYQAFLQWINFDEEWYPSDKAAWLEKHVKAWPDLGDKIAQLDEENRLNKLYKLKVNGMIVRELTGADGKELGKLMRIVKELLPREKALAYSEHLINLGVLFAYAVYKESE